MRAAADAAGSLARRQLGEQAAARLPRWLLSDAAGKRSSMSAGSWAWLHGWFNALKKDQKLSN